MSTITNPGVVAMACNTLRGHLRKILAHPHSILILAGQRTGDGLAGPVEQPEQPELAEQPAEAIIMGEHKVGDVCEMNFDAEWFAGVVTACDNTTREITASFEDGEVVSEVSFDDEDLRWPGADYVTAPPPADDEEPDEVEIEPPDLGIFAVGDRVTCLWATDEWYDATVVGSRNARSGKHKVRFDLDGKTLSCKLLGNNCKKI
jgi:hypothetical protein